MSHAVASCALVLLPLLLRLGPASGYRAGASGRWLLQPTPLSPGAHARTAAQSDAIGSCLCLRRDDLHRILSEALADAVQRRGLALDAVLQPGSAVVGFDDASYSGRGDPNGFVTARLANGQSVSGAVLIGADGLHSAVRAQLFPAVQPRYVGYRYARAVLTDAQRSAEAAYESWSAGKRFGVVPLRSPELFWFAVHDAPPRPIDQSTVAGSAAELEALKREFAGFHSPVGELLVATPASEVLSTDIYDLPPLPEWGRGHVALMGDAAHAMAPNLAQGACHAIEDALSIASHLTAAARQVERNAQPLNTGNGARSMGGLTGAYGSSPFSHALRAYESARKPRAHFIQRASRFVGVAGAAARPWSTLRDAALSVVPQPLKTVAFNALHRVLLGWSYTAPHTGQSLYPRLLGDKVFDEIATLSEPWARFHTAKARVVCEGSAVVRRTPGIATLIATAMRMPPPFERGRVKATITVLPGGREWWYREFTCADTGRVGVFATGQWCEGDSAFVESDGPMQFRMRLDPIRDAQGRAIGFRHVMEAMELLLYPWFPVRRRNDPTHPDRLSAVVPGPHAAHGPGYWSGPNGHGKRGFEVRIPIPRLFWPETDVTTHATAKGWRYDVQISSPRIPHFRGSGGWSLGPMLHYSGEIDTVTELPLKPDEN